LYVVNFSVSLEDGTPIAARGSCCPGEIGASVETDHVVVVSIPRVRREPVRASIVVP
jgi:hypothetical protein